MVLTVLDLYIRSMHILESVPHGIPRHLRVVGQPVSYQNIQAGDVVVYPGHVAIYIGNGKYRGGAVNKSRNYKQRPVNCHTITAIRRLV